MLNFVERPKARAGVFFVWKSARMKLRWIVDVRPGNMIFKAHPSVALCSSVTAGEVGIVGMDLGIGPYDTVFPCPSTLPMGFSWSVYLCQCAGETLFKRVTRFERCPVVDDRGGAPIFHEPSAQDDE